jgi:hypothetical protein
VTADRLALAVGVRKARRSSTCSACNRLVLVGDRIARLTSPPAWIHIGCVPAIAAMAKRRSEQTDGLWRRRDGRATPLE